MKKNKRFGLPTGVAFLLFLISCAPAPGKHPEGSFYTLDDFTRVPKVDAHVHIRTYDTAFVHQAGVDNFRLLSIVVDEAPGIEAQQQYAIYQMKRRPDVVSFATTFSVKDFDSGDWAETTIDSLRQAIKDGAVAVKVYKNIGMELTDRQGRMVMVDNPRFKPVWNFLTEARLPVIGHLGEPRNCWLPVEQMTINTDKRYYTRHPEFHMYLHPEFPSCDDQIAARDRMLEQNPQLGFIGAHLGSLEWSTDELAKWLDRFPGKAVDLAARISHLQLQTMKDREKVREFFLKYQDRLLYGTDRIANDSDSPGEFSAFVHQAWLNDWRFFCTEDTMRSKSFDGVFRGLKLPKTVVDKLYYTNAVNGFKLLK